jgi:predicted CopG family antitoxin
MAVVIVNKPIIALMDFVGREKLAEMLDEFDRLGRADVPRFDSYEVGHIHISEEMHYRLRKAKIEMEYRSFNEFITDIVLSYYVRRLGREVVEALLKIAPGGVSLGEV